MRLRALGWTVSQAFSGNHCPVTREMRACRAEGTAVAIAPTPEMLGSVERTAARTALEATAAQGAIAAYDRVPFVSAAAVFTMDTSSDIFMLHSGQARVLQALHH
jgi:hypothetical protein